MDRIEFKLVDVEESVEFYVLEETKIGGINYLLVTEEEEGDSDALILRELADDEGDVLYEVVESDEELENLSKIFMEILEDVDFEME